MEVSSETNASILTPESSFEEASNNSAAATSSSCNGLAKVGLPSSSHISNSAPVSVEFMEPGCSKNSDAHPSVPASLPSPEDSNDVPQFQMIPTNEAFSSELIRDRSKRFEYLLQQTELYAHFMRPAYKEALDVSTEVKAVVNDNETVGRGKRKAKPKVSPLYISEPVVKKPKKGKDKDEEGQSQESNGVPILPLPIQYEETPHFIKNGMMRDYQVRGLNWLVSLYQNGINGILADEMGLGKTLQTISLLGHLKHECKLPGPHLIIAPKSTLHNWLAEIERWCPSLKAICLTGDKVQRAYFKRDVFLQRKWNICVTSYEMVLREKSLLKSIKWQYLVIDEGQRIKNEKSKLSEYVRTFHSCHRLLLTGTPLQNDLHELWSLLNFLLPDVFSSSEDFDSWFNINNCLGEDNSLMGRLHRVLRPFLLRRVKSDVEKSLLPKTEMKLYIKLTKLQREWYRKLLLQDIDVVNASKVPGSKSVYMNIVMQLRKVCNHPYLFPGVEPGPPYTTDSHIVENCGKMIVLDKLLKKLQNQGSRVLLFCQMTTMLDILEDYCTWKELKYCRLDGATDHDVRKDNIDDFNSANSDKFIFLLSTRAGGLGINLATADVVILYDSDWNPQVDLQAIDRSHRIGQKKQVRIFRFVTENTVEEKIIERATIKARLDRLVIQDGRLVDANAITSNAKDLQNIVRFGADKIIEDDDSEFVTDGDIETILEYSTKRTNEMNEMIDSLNEEKLRNFTVDVPPPPPNSLTTCNAYEFEGQDYRVLRQNRRKNYDEMVSYGSGRRDKSNNKKTSMGMATNSELLELGIYSSDDESKTEEKKENLVEMEVKSPLPTFTVKLARAKKPRMVHDFQFYPPMYSEIYYKELDYHRRTINYEPPIMEDCELTFALKVKEEEENRIAKCQPLTAFEIKKKNDLMPDGFRDWTRNALEKFLAAVKEYGKESMKWASKVEGKPAESVVAYSQVFWSRCHELIDFEHLMELAGCDEYVSNARQEWKSLLDAKLAGLSGHTDIKISYQKTMYKGTRFSPTSDRRLLWEFYKMGVETPDVFNKLHQKIYGSRQFGVFLCCRTVEELHSRLLLLISLIRDELTLSQPEPSNSQSSATGSTITISSDDTNILEPKMESNVMKKSTTKPGLKSSQKSENFEVAESKNTKIKSKKTVATPNKRGNRGGWVWLGPDQPEIDEI